MKGFSPEHDRFRRIYAGAPSGRRTAAFRELRTYTAHLLEMAAHARSERRTATVVQLPLPLKRRHSGA